MFQITFEVFFTLNCYIAKAMQRIFRVFERLVFSDK